jgi:Protein of unknown function (DUF559)
VKTATVTGYLTQEKLAEALRTLVGDRWTGVELRVAGTKRRWDMGFSAGARRVVVEFDGDAHYRDALKIKADAEKDAIAKADGIHVVRFPYWVQLDQVTLRHYFDLDATAHQDFPHGFITTKLFPRVLLRDGRAPLRARAC